MTQRHVCDGCGIVVYCAEVPTGWSGFDVPAKAMPVGFTTGFTARFCTTCTPPILYALRMAIAERKAQATQ